jgi:hypothetical protein
MGKFVDALNAGVRAMQGDREWEHACGERPGRRERASHQHVDPSVAPHTRNRFRHLSREASRASSRLRSKCRPRTRQQFVSPSADARQGGSSGMSGDTPAVWYGVRASCRVTRMPVDAIEKPQGR